MAKSKKKTQAEKAASAAAPKNGGEEKKRSSAPKKAPKVKTEYEGAVPVNAVVACICLALFILFLIIGINPEGLLLKFLQSVVLGLIGQAGFYFSIPALLFIFVLNLFHRSGAKAQSICVAVFVFACGSIFHLIVQDQGIANGFGVIRDLYVGGAGGYTGGVLCGGVAMLLRWTCGTIVSYILLGILAVLTLLGSMQITIPSIIRAVANRPRDDWDEYEEEQEEVYVEPAAMVVNHIANKQIERKRQRRIQQQEEIRRLAEAPEEQEELPVITQRRQLPAASRTETPKAPIEAPVSPVSIPNKIARMFDNINQDTSTPVGFREELEELPEEPEFIPEPPKKQPAKPAVPVMVEMEEEPEPDMEPVPEPIPLEMPKYDPEEPIAKPKTVQLKPVRTTGKITAEDVVKPGKVSVKDAEESALQVAQEIADSQNYQRTEYTFPPVSLLKRPPAAASDGTEEMRENSRRLTETLESFKIDAHITNVTRGPSVTRYEVELDKGVRLNKLTNCADDIALSLGASGVRIAAVPGKISIVGIEVPNRSVTMVSLREVIDSPEFHKAKSKSSFAVGKDISGSCIVGNISKMPHMLIAGTTGSGKSVCMNSIIISLLYKSSPDDVKLIMVDPKMVELGIYNGIPHLLIPVVTDPKKAAGSLQWAVTEMLRRYKLMSDLGVRDLESYNSIVESEENGQRLPQCIIIIDELADLMLVAAKEVEDSICRIAQMGRAAGMHLIIATQRPSADVITGLMKANIPSRIAFSVASAMESRIILDTQGAEKLVGRGDMLYAPIGIGKPLRVQGCFVTDGEVEAIAGFVKDNYSPDYNQEVLEEIEKKAQQAGKSNKPGADPVPSDDELEGDEMLPAAVEVILETGQASVSMLQRRLKLGYARAARIVDEMEEKGIVGPFQGSKPRAILVTKEQWASMTGGSFDDGGVPEEID